MKIFKFFKKETKNSSLPDLIRKLDKNEITSYKDLSFHEKKFKDPLYMRISVEELDYPKEYYEEIPLYQKYISLPITRKFSKYFINKRFEKIIYRPNVSLRKPYFAQKAKIYKMSNFSKFFWVVFLGYLIGYTWAKLKYDIMFRRYMYCYCFSSMMLFEYIDYQIGFIKDVLDKYIPLDMSGDELEYILYKKIRGYYTKRKLETRFEEVVKTDKEIVEVDNLIK